MTDTGTTDGADLVRVEHRPDGVALVTLAHGKVNALSGAVLRRIAEVAEDLTSNPPGAVVVWGGERLFAAGADITEFGGPNEAAMITQRFRHAFDAVAGIPRMVIAAVSGFALGGGCELAMACDLRIAGEKAVFGQPEILLGIIPGAGGTQRLSRLVGPARAKELILSGRQVKADEAVRIGLADEVVPNDQLLDRALSVAAEYARGPLQAQALCKQAVDRGLDGSLADGLDLEGRLFVEVFRTDDARVGVQSFLEHGPGKATFTGT